MSGRLGRSLAVLRAAWREDRRRPRRRRRGDETDFLPAAVEILERPASPAGRWLALAIPALLATALVWAWVGEIDTVAVAPGRIVPAARTKVVQPLEIGVVRAIHVRDGQPVAQGETLVELDLTEAAADEARLAHDLRAARLDAARLEAMASRPHDPQAVFVAPPDAAPAMRAAAQALMSAESSAYRETLAELDAEIARLAAERRTVTARIEGHRAVIPLVRERVEAVARLVEKGHAGRLALTELRESLVEHEHALNVDRMRLEELAAAVEAQQRRRAERAATRAAQTARELTAAMRAAERLEEELTKASERVQATVLRAPVDGVVQQLAVHTVGGVVRPAEPLMVVVPAGAALEVEAMLPNKDVGFVREGQVVAVKVESFPFTRYGLIPGRVVHVSADAVADPQAGLVYPLRVSLEEDAILVDGRHVPLGPGMAVVAEVKTGKRRLLEFFLSPFLEYRGEALRER